jgi:hypothetical protein
METFRMIFRPLLCAAISALLGTTGCRLQVDKSQDGEDKNVKIETPLGGLHVRSGTTVASDVGLPAYPGANATSEKNGDKSADVHLGFGQWQLRVRVATYQTSDSQEQVITFYRNALSRYGDVIECNGNASIGTPKRTHEGLTCDDSREGKKIHVSDFKPGSFNLKAGSQHHQHIVAIKDSNSSGTRFSLLELQLPIETEGKPEEAN